MGPVDARKVLSLAIDLELKASACYEKLASMPGSEAFRDDLRHLAQEEVVHANLLRSGKEFEALEPEAFGQTMVPVERLEDHIGQADAFLAELDAGGVAFAEAVRRIRDLEFAFERVHMGTLLEVRSPRLEKLFRALSAQDAAHALRLEAILRDL
jgi:rubrerythrin